MVLVAFLFLTACTADPRKDAQAFETRSEAEQAVLNAEQVRAQEQALNEIELQEARRDQEIKDAALEQSKSVYGLMIYWGGITATIALMFVIVSVGRSLKTAIEGFGEAAARKAIVQANLIYLDKATGQYPLLLEHVGKGVYSLTNMNTEKTLLLNTRNESDRLAIRGAMAIQHALVMSNAAVRSKDPTGVAMIAPLILDQNGDEV